jgi:hypothetical protein
MRENGLRIEGDRGETHLQPAQATADIAGKPALTTKGLSSLVGPRAPIGPANLCRRSH